MGREFDLIVFGASGFTGRYVALEVAKCSKAEGKSWAVAGRSLSKLKQVVADIQDELGENLNDVGIIAADVNDSGAMLECCKKGDIILDCVGPFRFYGEQVVSACVKAKTNYVDVSGEPEFLENMQFKYSKQAEEAGIHIVGACGFDSIPVDCGIEFMRQKFNGELTAVESYLKYHGRIKGNIGTFESLINGVATGDNLKSIRKRLMPEKMKYVGQRLEKRGSLFYSKSENLWTVLFTGADPSVVRRTQYSCQESSGETPVQYGSYMCLSGILELVCLLIFGVFLAILTPFQFGRNLLMKYPKLFTFGTFSYDGLTREELAERSFTFVFYGRGYSSESQKTGKPDKAIGLKINEPGYVATPIFLVQAALTILEGNLPNKGGVFTPGRAFKNTSLIDRLIKSGIEISTFQVDTKDF
ncbi:saccharopine dehydrogenase-like oxidoreductase isoform X1 [Rhopilema esculentum]|uniref:saccharopine dehydrogenase-like oxidoreductase isoform X1 n=1 Tax=Rhopilema esculentum TaxID=499914 RepID=UPI0031DE824C